jgi:hypothetical protein
LTSCGLLDLNMERHTHIRDMNLTWEHTKIPDGIPRYAYHFIHG